MRRILTIVICLVAFTAAARAQAPKLPPDLALVPEDGIGFVHVRVAELWGHESLKEVRDILKKAGDKAIAALDDRLAGLPSNVERLTLWVGPSRSRRRLDSDFLFVVRLARPTDAGKLRALLVPDASAQKGKRFSWYVDDIGASLLIADDRTFVLGPKTEVARLADGTKSNATPLRDSIAFAADNRPLTVAFVPSSLPAGWQEDIMAEIPLPLRPMTIVQAAAASLDLAGDGQLRVRITYPTTTGAEAAERMLKSPDGPVRKLIATTRNELTEMALGDSKALDVRQVPLAAVALMGLGVLNQLEETLKSDRIRRDGRAIDAVVQLPARSKTILVPAAFAAGALIAGAASNWREDIRSHLTNDLKQMVLAYHNYDVANGHAVAAITDGGGKPLLSWRVALLPYLEQDHVYRQFKLDEPWDSADNKKLIDKMPKIYAIDGVTTKIGQTHYRTFVGPKAPWAFDRHGKIGDIVDGTSNTVLFVQAKEPVIWTKPEELLADGKQEIKSRLLFREGRTIVGMADGSVRFIRNSVKDDVWKLLIDPADGQPIPAGVLK
jgi:hypothetical protein